MAKKITEKIVESCKHCPNCWTEIHGEDTYVRCGKNSKLYDDFDSIPPDCPLEEAEEEKFNTTCSKCSSTKVFIIDGVCHCSDCGMSWCLRKKNPHLEQFRKDIPEETKQEVELAHKLAEEAIGFGEWILKHEWQVGVRAWFTWKQNDYGFLSMLDKTTSELYDEYSKSKQQ